jgi:aminoglycoside 2'-N-acetyltransferase I
VAGLRTVRTEMLSRAELSELRDLFAAAFAGEFTDDDWDHTVGGVHLLVGEDRIVAHASIVERLLVAGDRPIRTGYVESVATAPAHQGRGLASTLMRAAGEIIRDEFELGGLATGLPDFYSRFGWELWSGPTYTSSPRGPQRTPEDDGAVMVLRTAGTRDLDLSAPLMCDWRFGDVW